MQTSPFPSSKKKGQNLSKSIYSPAVTSRRQTTLLGPSSNSIIMTTNGSRDEQDFFDMPKLIGGSGRLSYRDIPTKNNLRHSVSPMLQANNGSRRDSILSPQDMSHFEPIVQDEDQFDRVFQEGLKEVEAIDQDFILSNTQQEIFLQTKQLIQVGSRQFPFSKDDGMFKKSHSPLLDQLGMSADQQDSAAFKKKLQSMVPINMPNCFCCGKDIPTSGGNKKQRQIEVCHFCAHWGCGECVEKSFPFPIPVNRLSLYIIEQIFNGQYSRGRICRVCETQFYIKQKLDEIFKRIDDRNKDAESLSQEIIQYQNQITDRQMEIKQQELAQINFQTDHTYKVEQLRNKITDLKEMLEKQQRESQKITQRIAQRKDEFEQRNIRAKEVRVELEQTRGDMQMREVELEAKLKDKDFIRNYLRQLNPTKKQPMQGSFKPVRTSNQITNGDGSSLTNSNIEGNPEGGEYQDENVLDFAKLGTQGNSNYRRHQSTVVEPGDRSGSRKSRKSIALAQSSNKACCDSGCYIF